MSVRYVQVAPISGAPGLFTYRVPEPLLDRVPPGMRVLVPFGRRPLTGFVVAEADGPPPGFDPANIRPIADVLDPEPLVAPALLELLRWAASYYMTPLGELFKAALPAGLYGAARRTARRTGAASPPDLAGPKAALLTALGDEPLECKKLLKRVGGVARMRHLTALAEAGLVELEYVIAGAAAKPRTEVRWRSTAPPTHKVKMTAKRATVLEVLQEAGVHGASTSDVGARVPAPGAQLRWLVREGLAVRIDAEVLRDPFSGDAPARDSAPPWNDEQAGALEVIGGALALGEYRGILVHGVTGSGKTEVYLEAIRQVTEAGRQALVLVPEIALTPQLAGRFRARFGERVAVLHSGLSVGERYDQWRRIRRGDTPIALGARSAVFAPLDRLGIVVVDEEHDPSYKQDDGPRYDGRNLALVRARDAGAVALLGSATPSLESHHGAVSGRLTRVTLTTRPTGGELPVVTLVDLRKSPPDQPLAPALTTALQQTLQAGEQSILFLNRRGWSGFVLCRTCGRQWQCGNCSVSLKHHRAARELRCHYCDHVERFPERCPDCADPEVGLFNLGTEQLQAATQALLPGARVVRLDRDTASRKHGVQEVIDGMRRREIDVLVGTQMVTKGHDFPGVTLVGVVAADLALNLADFRAAERTFQLLTQVAGRAGRGDRPGGVIIQTFAPTHFALTAAQGHDYGAFAERELQIRRELGYPPYGHMVAFKLSGEDEARVRTAAAALGRALSVALSRPEAQGEQACAVLGPNKAPLELLRGRHRWQVLIKGADRNAVRSLAWAGRSGIDPRVLSGVRLAIDVDPIHML